MSRIQLVDQLAEILSSLPETSIDEKEVTVSSRLREDLGVDSLGMIDLILEIEARYDVVLDPIRHDFFVGFETVGSLADLVIAVMVDGL